MKSKRAIIAIVVVLVVAAFTGLIVWFVSQQDESRLIKSGEVLVSTHCAKCHASGRSEISPIPAAPAFRTLFRRYPAESLVESLGEGLTSRHPDMPTFVFSANEVAAIMLYLDSIQEP
jgi:cytochrome c